MTTLEFHMIIDIMVTADGGCQTCARELIFQLYHKFIGTERAVDVAEYVKRTTNWLDSQEAFDEFVEDLRSYVP